MLKLHLCANMYVSQFKEATKALNSLQKKPKTQPELPHNNFYQNGCATCLVKDYCPLRSSKLF